LPRRWHEDLATNLAHGFAPGAVRSVRHDGGSFAMKTMLMIAAALGATMLAGCATYATDDPSGGYYFYDVWGSDGNGGKGHHRGSGGGRSEPGNEAGMFPGRPGDGRGGASSGGGASRGGEAGSR
jgi:hypothetical protein